MSLVMYDVGKSSVLYCIPLLAALLRMHRTTVELWYRVCGSVGIEMLEVTGH